MDQDQLSEVKQWIGSLSMELSNETYELNEFTVSYLFHLSQLNKKKDQHLQHQKNENIEMSEEFSAENERIGKELLLLGIDEKYMNEESANSLSNMADIGNSLGISCPSMENYLLNLSELSMEELKSKELMKTQEALLDQISDMLQNLEHTLQKLSDEIDESSKTRDVNEVDVPVEIEKAKAQAQHYLESTKEYKKLLSASGVKKEYTHEALQTLSTKVTSLMTEIKSIEDKLSQFKQLPPSMPLAQEKIRQVKEEIGSLEKMFPELSLCS